MSLAYKYVLSIGCKLFIKCNKVFVLPELDGPIINILNGQSLRSEELNSAVDPFVSLFFFYYLQYCLNLAFYILVLF